MADCVQQLRKLQRKSKDQCASSAVFPCPDPDVRDMSDHECLVKESCFCGDLCCGHTFTTELLGVRLRKNGRIWFGTLGSEIGVTVLCITLELVQANK